jgi:hypothetical protein
MEGGESHQPSLFVLTAPDQFRGDARMGRAVNAKLKDPQISLSDALRVGGFNYSETATASVVDDENVTLGQRKNQLSRRLRKARQQLLLQQQRQPPISTSSPVGYTASAVMVATGDRYADVPASAWLHQHEGNQTPHAQITTNGFAVLHDGASNQHSAANDSRLTQLQTPHIMEQHYSLESNASIMYYQLVSQQSPTQPPPPPAPQASLQTHPEPMDRCHLVPQAWESFSLTDQSMTLVDATPRTSVPRDPTGQPTEHPGTPSASVEDFRLQMALQILHEQTKGLYCQAMLSAGYSWEEVQDSSPTYQQFALIVCEKERKRLQQLLSDDTEPNRFCK